jgi:hypothetical protein
MESVRSFAADLHGVLMGARSPAAAAGGTVPRAAAPALSGGERVSPAR